ncbi:MULTISPECIES: RES family NAD+ phosphorylase [unclassified Thalassospira]|uniref:RES family NAD+ phosphorylase n=1 Tax=unclassified Thalassospira TaxID=2648997 RepID=UPI001B0206A2|nr:RES family NAD+ phosphorylase [Thalassospira sp.]MBO6772247.1 RES domain-containing protein [Thalassospira sp.]
MRDITAFRLVKRKWMAAAFDGEGARLYGGRWNSRGQPAIYLAGSQSLALLEVMVHLNDYRLLGSYVMFALNIPLAAIEELPENLVPADWRAEPAPPSTAGVGDAWLNAKSALALAVPSVIIPQERNYLLNPNHPMFEAVVQTASEVQFSADPRL